jgi:acyl-CoA thioester hydrolase
VVKSFTKIRVRYADTDQMRVVYHGKYLEYFELGRSDLIRNLGLPYSQLESEGIFLPVVEAFAKYRRPAHYDEVLIVESEVKEIPMASLRIEYRVFRDGEHELLAEGYTLHSFLNVATGKPTRAPKALVDVLQHAAEQKTITV